MQNKPNLRKAEMKLNLYSAKDYENKSGPLTTAKQTQNKPNQSQFATDRPSPAGVDF
jgi:hypothetical protein